MEMKKNLWQWIMVKYPTTMLTRKHESASTNMLQAGIRSSTDEVLYLE